MKIKTFSKIASNEEAKPTLNMPLLLPSYLPFESDNCSSSFEQFFDEDTNEIIGENCITKYNNSYDSFTSLTISVSLLGSLIDLNKYKKDFIKFLNKSESFVLNDVTFYYQIHKEINAVIVKWETKDQTYHLSLRMKTDEIQILKNYTQLVVESLK